MILARQDLIVPDAPGPKRPIAVTVSWPAGSDVTLPFAVKHASGAAYDLSGAVAGILAFREREIDVDPLVQREWTITDAVNGLVEFSVVRGDVALLPQGSYAIGVQFRDDDTSFEDTVTAANSRAFVGPRIADFDEPITVLPSQEPLAQGPPGLSSVRALAAANLALIGIPAAQDGVTLVQGDDVLLTGQTIPSENGPWTVNSAAWTRPSYFASGAQVSKSTPMVRIAEGTTYGGQIWQCTTKAPSDVIDTDNLTFSALGAGSGRAPAIGVLGAVDIEDPIGVLGPRRRATYDDIDAAFSGTFTGTFAAARAMASPLVNPQFTFTANAALSAVAGDVTVTDDTDTQNIVPPTSPFGYGAPGILPARSYVSSVRNASKSWDLKLTKLGGSPVIHRFASVQFQAPVYFGKSTSLGPYNAAFITGLSSGAVLASAPQRDIATTTGAGEFVFYVYPAADGGTPSDFIDVATGFPFGVTKVAASVSVDNGFGVFVLHDVWRSDFPNLGTTTLRRI